MPGLLLILLAVTEAGDILLTELLDWPAADAYQVTQAAGRIGMWAVLAAWAPQPMRWPAWAVCAWGVWEAAQRVACYSAWLLWPRPVAHDMTLCEAYTGLDLYRWTLVGLCVLGALIGGWASRAGGR